MNYSLPKLPREEFYNYLLFIYYEMTSVQHKVIIRCEQVTLRSLLVGHLSTVQVVVGSVHIIIIIIIIFWALYALCYYHN